MPSVGVHQAQIATYDYDFAKHGGAIGSINLTGGGNGGTDKLPDNSLILRAWLEPSTTFTGGTGATIALGVTGNTGAALAATAVTDTRFAAGALSTTAAALPVKVDNTAGVNVLLTVAAAALTAGKAQVHVEYLPGS